jgi:uncharacterized membrane protein
MDTTGLDLMRIPFATVLFLASVFLLSTYFSRFKAGGVLGTVGALACICVLVYSMVLYSNMDMPLTKT